MTFRYDLTRLQVVLELGAATELPACCWAVGGPGATLSVLADGRACPANPGLSDLMRGVPLGGIDAARAASLLVSLESMNRGSATAQLIIVIRAARDSGSRSCVIDRP